MSYLRILFLGNGCLVPWMGFTSFDPDVVHDVPDVSVRFEVVDGLVIGYLGELTLLTERSDGSEWLLLVYYRPEIDRYALPSFELLGSVALRPGAAYSRVKDVNEDQV